MFKGYIGSTKMSINLLLQQCVVRLTSPAGMGTGFFITPGIVLTCSHVVGNACSNIEVYWEEINYSAKIVAQVPDDDIDLAILQLLNPPNHPCVAVDRDDPELTDPLYAFGHPANSKYFGGDPITLEYEGPSRSPLERKIYKLKNGQVQSGFSGSPLLNRRTNKVCGVITETRDEFHPTGGRAIPISAAFEHFKNFLSYEHNKSGVKKEWKTFFKDVQSAKTIEPGLDNVSDYTDDGYSPLISDENFRNLLSKYSNSLPIEVQAKILDEVALYAWEKIVYDTFSSEIIQKDKDQILENQPIFKKLFKPLFRVASGRRLNREDLNDFFELDDELVNELEEQDGGYCYLARKLIINLLHSQPDILEGEIFRERIRALSSKSKSFQSQFFVDLYFRYVCDTIDIPDNSFLQFVISVSEDYWNKYNQAPLSQLRKFIITPLDFLETVSSRKEDITKILQSIAGNCGNFIEAKWCVAALSRIRSLWELPEDDASYEEPLISLIESFPKVITQNSPQITYLRLASLLKAFLYTKELRYLCKYEEEFREFHSIVPHPSKLRLQLEYAASLHTYLTDEYIQNKLSHSDTNRAIKDRFKSDVEIASFLSDPLFRNDLNLRFNSYQGNRVISGIEFLDIYIKDLYNSHAKALIKANPLYLLEFRALRRVDNSDIRKSIPSVLLQSLKRFLDEPELFRKPSFYAKCLDTFSCINRESNIKLILDYIEEALKADRYSIIRNAQGILWGLYTSFFYERNSGNQIHIKERVHSLLELFLKQFSEREVPISVEEMSKLYWAYYAGIKWNELPHERLFINDFSEYVGLLKRVPKLMPEGTSDASASIDNKTIEFIQQYKNDSVLAKTLLSNLTNPEAWNRIGTIILDNKDSVDEDKLLLRKAAYFYFMAKWFVKELYQRDHKYSYNFIRCMGLFYKESNLCPEIGFFLDIAGYISDRNNWQFTYKEDSIKGYLELLQQCWPDILPAGQNTIRRRLRGINWLRRGNNPLLQRTEFNKLSSYL